MSAKKPLVSAAIRAWEGQLATFRPWEGGPCYRCFVGARPDDERGCNDAGVLGAFAGVIGSMQGLEVIKELVGIGNLGGRLLRIDALTYRMRIAAIARDPQCACCG